jgi:general stress protein YciG
MLYTNIPKYESLDQAQKEVYHEDKERFDEIARKGGKVLIYAKAGTSHETWVPIIEKAYAKLYGCYAHIGSGGQTREAIEDLTGLVTIHLLIPFTTDILPQWGCFQLERSGMYHPLIRLFVTQSTPRISWTPTSSGKKNCPG